jgi:hypothetical protein
MFCKKKEGGALSLQCFVFIIDCFSMGLALP